MAKDYCPVCVRRLIRVREKLKFLTRSIQRLESANLKIDNRAIFATRRVQFFLEGFKQSNNERINSLEEQREKSRADHVVQCPH